MGRDLNEDEYDFVSYDISRHVVADVGTRFASVLVSDIATTSAAQLLPTTLLYNDVSASSPASGSTTRSASRSPGITAGAVVLRPGECAAADFEENGKVCNWQTLNIDEDEDGVEDDTDYEDNLPEPGVLMRDHPVQVLMYAKVEMLNPFFSYAVARGIAAGYRSPIPRTPLGDEIVQTYAPSAPEPVDPPSPPTVFEASPENDDNSAWTWWYRAMRATDQAESQGSGGIYCPNTTDYGMELCDSLQTL